MRALLVAVALTVAACAPPAADPADVQGEQRARDGVLPDVQIAEHVVEVDLAQRTHQVTSTLTLAMPRAGVPLLALRGPAGGFPVDVAALLLGAMLDGEALPAGALVVRRDPDGQNAWVSLRTPIAAGPHQIVVRYASPAFAVYPTIGDAFELEDGGLELKVNSRETAGFLERYFIGPHLGDAAQQRVELHLLGASPGEYAVYANGAVSESALPGGTRLDVRYPDWLDPTGTYLHVLPRARVREVSGSFRSVDGRDVGVVVYEASTDGIPAQDDHAYLQGELDRVLAQLAALEGFFGPYPHDGLVASVDDGLMEFAGAVMGPVRHELIHQWFARSATPAAARDFWVDEAITSYLDDVLPDGGQEPSFAPVPLGHHRVAVAACGSTYQSIDRLLYRGTEVADGGYGAASLLRELQSVVGRDRVVGALRAFHAAHRRSFYRTRDFAAALEAIYPAAAPQPFSTWFGPLPACD